MKSRTLWIMLGLMMAILIVGVYFVLTAGTKKTPMVTKDASLTKTPESSSSPFATNTASPSGDIKKVEVVGTEFSYSPDTLTFNTGDSVQLTFKNEGTVSHNLAIEDLGLATKIIAPNSSDTIEFTVEKAGTYNFFCTVDSHEALGMKGTIEVK